MAVLGGKQVFDTLNWEIFGYILKNCEIYEIDLKNWEVYELKQKNWNFKGTELEKLEL